MSKQHQIEKLSINGKRKNSFVTRPTNANTIELERNFMNLNGKLLITLQKLLIFYQSKTEINFVSQAGVCLIESKQYL